MEGLQEYLISGPPAAHSHKPATSDPRRPVASVLCLWRQPSGHRAWVSHGSEVTHFREEEKEGRRGLRHSGGSQWAWGHGGHSLEWPRNEEEKKKKKHQVGEVEMLEVETAESMAEMAEPMGLPFPSASSSKKRKSKPTGGRDVPARRGAGTHGICGGNGAS